MREVSQVGSWADWVMCAAKRQVWKENMYYEEKLINGILNWRNDPDKEFVPYSLAELSSRYVALVDLRTEKGKERSEIEVDIWTPERVARVSSWRRIVEYHRRRGQR